MEKIILWGTSGMTQIVEYYINKEKAFEICGYTLDRDFIKEDTYNSKPVIPFDEVEKHFSPSEYKMGIFMSPKNLNRLREEKYKLAKEKGYSFINFISKDAICDYAKIGENVFILPNAVIQPFSEIGNNVIIWQLTHVGHHSVVEDNCSLASSKSSGYCIIEKNTFLGVNSTIADHVKIGAYSIIGAGATVLKNVKEGSVLAVKQTPKQEMTSFELEDYLQ